MSEVTFKIDDFELSDEVYENLTVICNYTPGYTAPVDKYGLPIQPDEPEELELVKAELDSGENVLDSLSIERKKKLQAECWKELESSRVDTDY